MNEVMDEWGSANFKDKLLWDTKLSGFGINQCKKLNKRFQNPSFFSEHNYVKKVELVVSSPLVRAIDTANLALEGVHDSTLNIPKIALPLAAERLYMSSEVGKSKSTLESLYADWDFTNLSDDEWWYTIKDVNFYQEWRPPGEYAVPGEPREDFIHRMNKFREWIDSRKETCIIIFTHWGVIRALTGLSFVNCEVGVVKACYLRDTPLVDN
jgi:broad specificity phosphatase PhoE